MQAITFKTDKQMVNWLMNNEGKVLGDSYGRRWMYSSLSFFFRDIGVDDKLEPGLVCLHLYGTKFHVV